ncbi:hypothetical protein L289_2443 [Acinetobacter gerneri DSM 14967 = CIP 107464 = MTCC 9824]|nr:hypothetical protein L289_2443 [Acinetobacter gerneri DSM 14967 = CIP 107464 = MTCC 9824]
MIKLQRNSIKKHSRPEGLWLKLSQASLRNLKMVSPFSAFHALPAQF